ncbi:MAG: cytidylate kinase-like family protein [Ktedonobacteraceae bacterium]|nr:cytidylate kinase-like family protein [Ktedonobacteraceae bacterium]
MNERNALLSQMRAVTLSREYGSGGGEIARRLAERLGWQLVDHEIVARVAQELNISEEEAEEYDERAESTVSLILNSMRAISPAMFTAASEMAMTDSQTFREVLSRVVEAAVETQHAVIVGRGSQVLLKDRRDVLHARIVAPLEKRIRYVMQREACSRTDAEARIRLKDHDRQRYLQTQYRCRPDDAHLYDIILNTGVLSLDSAVDLLILALERKAAQLSVPAEKLGPAPGLPPYSGRPGDFHPPEA